jgi:hypothetical protein
VPASVAALSLADRIGEPTTPRPGQSFSVNTDEGIWLASRLPRESGLGCDANDSDPDMCADEYGEFLLLNSARSRILRAFPLPSIPPQRVVLSDDAVYCARQGDGGLPDSMVCRIDRATLAWIVRVFAPLEESVSRSPAGREDWPSNWALDESELEVLDFDVDTSGVWAKAYPDADGWTQLDPETLEVQQRGVARSSR